MENSENNQQQSPSFFKTIHKRLKSFTILSTIVLFLAVLVVAFFIAFIETGIVANVIFFKLEIFRSLIYFLTHLNSMPLWLIMIPLVGGAGEFVCGRRSDKLRDVLVVNLTFVTLILIMAMYPSAISGGLLYQMEGVLGLGLSFKIDMLGLTMLLITSILWFLVMIYSHEYMMHEQHRNRFYLFMAITYSAVLGTIMAGDLLTMFLFFEVMTFSSYMLVSHGQNKEAMEAGYNYIFMGVIGGLSILLGMILLYANIGHVRFEPIIAELERAGSIKFLIVGLLILGFGIKAGMAPVHVWLPRAHPVAPTPASALLSGIMIKVGAFGILRVTTSYFFPHAHQISGAYDLLWQSSKTLGAMVIWLGIITMAIGVFFALQQSNIKKMLAYHSISQMGYIVMGIGVALYLGYKGAMGYSGALYHIINHALFKSLLFMVAGVVYLQTKELDMYKLGGLWRKLPITAFLCFIAVLGITGMPGFNGFASKSMLHHAIVEAYQYGHFSFRYAEIMFNVISAGTVCSFIKFFGFVFLGKLPKRFESIQYRFNSMQLAMGAIAIIIVSIGLFPNVLLNDFILPAVRSTTYDPAFIQKYLVSMNFFNTADMLNMVWIYVFGAAIFIMGIKYHWFHLHMPKWLKLEYIMFYPINRLMHLFCKVMGHCSCEAEVLALESAAYNPFDGDETGNQMGFIQRLVTTISVFTKQYEGKIINSDVTIYAIVLTLILCLLVVFG